MSRADLGVAAVQLSAVPGDVGANARRALAVATEAIGDGAELVVLPELSLTGYDLSLLHEDTMWFQPDDPRLDALRALTAQSGATVVVGAPVVHDARRSLASLVLGPDGSVVVAPKSHLHGAEVDHFAPGAGPVTVDVAGWRVALAVCVDTSFPDHAQRAAAAGADVYAASVLYTRGEERRLDVRLGARALDNGLYTVAANVAGHPLGERSAGGSGAWAPDGSRIAAAAGRDDEIVHARIAPPAL